MDNSKRSSSQRWNGFMSAKDGLGPGLQKHVCRVVFCSFILPKAKVHFPSLRALPPSLTLNGTGRTYHPVTLEFHTILFATRQPSGVSNLTTTG
jgi:hypothetical protein